VQVIESKAQKERAHTHTHTRYFIIYRKILCGKVPSGIIFGHENGIYPPVQSNFDILVGIIEDIVVEES